MKKWKELFLKDLHRYGDSKPDRITIQFLKYFRKCQCTSSFFNRLKFRRIKQRLNIELYGGTKIGYGLYVGHPFGITINADAVIGNNCNIHKGVTIGQENRGKRKGVPTIGDMVWIGANVVIVGKITIGNNVLIAPGAFVNFDVPDNSIVIGNPGKVIMKEDPTSGYINFIKH